MEKTIKTPKGTRDYAGGEKILLDEIITKTESIYRRRGGVPFDSPNFEIKSILTNKYGEDSKLIYDLADQGGEACALRYDLTVPLARHLAMNKKVKIKRYQTGKVFRRDQPALARGRYREFYQSDFDIVGEYAHMAADAEIVSCADEILKVFSAYLDSKEYVIRINHKKLVDSMMEVCGIDKSIEKSIGSSIDKLDKMEWKEVAKEMEEKGASEESIEQIKNLLVIKVPISKIDKISGNKIFQTEKGKEALKDLQRLNELLVIYNSDDRVLIDISLVRGLEYYTGILLEGGYEGIEGTVIAGGRYDGLVDSLSTDKKGDKKTDKSGSEIDSKIDNPAGKTVNNPNNPKSGTESDKKNKKNKSVIAPGSKLNESVNKRTDKSIDNPVDSSLSSRVDSLSISAGVNRESVKCVGVSLGVSRLFSLVDRISRKSYTDVVVCSVGSNLLEERIRMCTYLRSRGINTEYFMGDSNNFTRHSEYADSVGAEVLVLIGRKELENNTCQVITGDKKSRIKSTVNIPEVEIEIRNILKREKEQ